VSDFAALAEFGCATVHEALGKKGVVDLDLVQVIPGSRAAGPARIARCGQDDNLMVHAAVAALHPGEVLVVTMPRPAPIGLVGELLASQAKYRGAAAILVDAAVRDVEELRTLGLPVWARWIRVTGASKEIVGELDVAVKFGDERIAPGDAVVLDSDGAVVVPSGEIKQTIAAAAQRHAYEEEKKINYLSGTLSLDVLGLRGELESRGITVPGSTT